VNNLPKD
jgi:uncharacterized membrane protein YfhO